ncbi:MAG: xanthine dehydrogenase family protein molybdopterin-binding subunit [Proteobacteria bacterium]|nr:xanthine dehydrogenase family protein molybdopterin-binding subunit [Pseudomonadota bacterium]
MKTLSFIEDIGRRSPRFDAPDKARGKEKFASDLYPENLLWAGALRAGIPHGEIRSIIVDRALSMAGVHAVLTRKDVPGPNRQGFVYWDMPVLCGKKVRHAGDAVALVIAETREILAKALESIQVDISPLPVVDSIDAALSDQAPKVHDLTTGNLLKAATITKGDPAVLATCDILLEEYFSTPVQEHAYLETENGVARLDKEGILHLIVSTQAPFRDRLEIARALGLDPGKIHITAPYLGGGFGGKDGATVQCLLALAALHAKGRPVKMWWDREESMVAGYKRHAARMHYCLGAKKDGELVALKCEIDYDTGAYAHLGVEIMALGLEHAAGPYRIPNMEAKGRCIYTNNPIAGAFRGFGVAQVSFAFEGMMDRLALKLNMDPLALRRKNALIRGDKNCADITMTHSTGMAECLLRLADHYLWTDRGKWVAAAPRFKRRGVGISAVFNGMGYGHGLPDYAVAKVRLTQSGTIRVYNGVSDMGQGNAATFVQMAVEILCQDRENMELVQPDTDRTHPSGSSSAGRTTYTYGNALIKACTALRDKLCNRAALMLLMDDARGFAMVPGAVRHLATGKEISLAALAAIMHPEDRLCVADHLMVTTPEMPQGGEAFSLGFPHLIYPFAAHLARVEVDELTGGVCVKDYLAFTDGGRVLNPQTFEQQVQGAVAQGIGYALCEAVQTTQSLISTRDLSTYILPTSLDLPDIQSHCVETIEHSGPFGMKGIGEVGLNGPLPAIGSALIHAGLPMNRAPFTPERILAALQGQADKKKEPPCR